MKAIARASSALPLACALVMAAGALVAPATRSASACQPRGDEALLFDRGKPSSLGGSPDAVRAVVDEAVDLLKTHDDRPKFTVTDEFIAQLRAGRAVEVRLVQPIDYDGARVAALIVPIDATAMKGEARIFTGDGARWAKFGAYTNSRGAAKLAKLVDRARAP